MNDIELTHFFVLGRLWTVHATCNGSAFWIQHDQSNARIDVPPHRIEPFLDLVDRHAMKMDGHRTPRCDGIEWVEPPADLQFTPAPNGGLIASAE